MADESDKKIPPKPPLGDYPYNLVKVWADGRELHVNTTPGNFSTRYWTPSGTTVDIDKDGRYTQISKGSHYTYSRQGISTTADSNMDVKVNGAQRSVVDGGSHSESGESTTSAVHGSVTNISKEGSISSTASGAGENIVNGNQVTKVNGDIHLAVNGDNVSYTTGSNVSHISGESLEVVNGNKSTSITGQMKFIIGNKLIITCSSLEIISQGEAKITASNIKLESGTLTHNGANIGDSHRHGGVMPGGALTGVPS